MKNSKKEFLKHIGEFYEKSGKFTEMIAVMSLGCFFYIHTFSSGKEQVKFPEEVSDSFNVLNQYGLFLENTSHRENTPSDNWVLAEYLFGENASELLHESIQEIIKASDEFADKFDIYKFETFFEIFVYSTSLSYLLKRMELGKDIVPAISFLFFLIEIRILIENKFFEARGFWKAKIEEKKRGMMGGEAKKIKVEKNLNIIQELLREYPEISVDKRTRIEFITEAMKRTQMASGRTISNYLKKLGSGKNEGFSKKDI